MKINANEMLLLNKQNTMAKGIPAAKYAEAPMPKPAEFSISALDAQGMNNVAFQGVSKMLAKPASKALIALSVLAGAATLQSCSKEPWLQVEQNVSVDMSMVNQMYQQMLELWKAMLEQQKISNEQFTMMNSYMADLLKEVQAGNMSLNEFKAAVLQHFVVDEQNQAEIINQLKNIGKTEEDIKALLTPFFEAYNKGDMQAAWDAYMDIMNAIKGHVGNIDATTAAILQQLKAMEASINLKIDDAKNSAIQNKAEILVALYELKDELAKVQPSSVDLSKLEEWMAIINESIKGIDVTQPSAPDYTQLLTSILNAINNIQTGGATIDTSVLEGLAQAILDKLNTMDANQQKSALDLLNAVNGGKTAIINAINNLSQQGKADLQALLDAVNANTDAVNENTTYAKGSYEILVWFMNNIDKFDRADDIIAAIYAASQNVKVDFTGLMPYLQQILDAINGNGDKLDNIYEKLDQLKAQLIAEMEALGDDNEEIKALLQQILDKIPPEHNCDHDALIQILIEIKSLMANKHEGTDQGGGGNMDDIFN